MTIRMRTYPGGIPAFGFAVVTVLMLVAPGLCGCNDRGLDTRTISIKGHRLTVEVARTQAEHRRGLQERDRLAAQGGMLFIFEPDSEDVAFWMDKTRIPLSVAFIGREGVITQIEKMQPMTRDLHPSREPVSYVLEVNQGWFERHGVRVGDVVELSGLQ